MTSLVLDIITTLGVFLIVKTRMAWYISLIIRRGSRLLVRLGLQKV